MLVLQHYEYYYNTITVAIQFEVRMIMANKAFPKTKMRTSYPRRVEQSEGRQANLGPVGPFLVQELNRGVHGRSGTCHEPHPKQGVPTNNQLTHKSTRSGFQWSVNGIQQRGLKFYRNVRVVDSLALRLLGRSTPFSSSASYITGALAFDIFCSAFPRLQHRSSRLHSCSRDTRKAPHCFFFMIHKQIVRYRSATTGNSSTCSLMHTIIYARGPLLAHTAQAPNRHHFSFSAGLCGSY